MSKENVVMEFTQDGKQLILDHLFKMRITEADAHSAVLHHVTVEAFKVTPTFEDLMAIIGVIALASHIYHWPVTRIVDAVESGKLLDEVFEEAKVAGDVDLVLKEAETVIVHLDKNGDITKPILH